MATLDDDNPFLAPPRPPASRHDIGQPLDSLSVGELAERIELLRAEIVRLEEARGRKLATKQAADAFFKS
jgi:uncharacterized small protein (DUF1192 family)